MPLACFKSVYAVSSEDPSHNASNLLKTQSGKKWKTERIGEKSAHIILQLHKPQQITGIDIGNEHSAFIMVSVGKLASNKEEFKDILITSSFMTPIESKNSTNINRVRCFAVNALVESVAKEKWELVKVTCTQPFNRHVQYGLSFITVHVTGEKFSDNELNQSKNRADTMNCARIGPLQLREDSPDSEGESSSFLFSRWKQLQANSLSAAAAIRAASSPLALKTNSNLLKPSKVEINNASKRSTGSPKHDGTHKVRDRNRNDLFYDEEDEAPNERLENIMSTDRERLESQHNSRGQNKEKNQSETKSDFDGKPKSRKDSPSSHTKSRKPDSLQHREPSKTSNGRGGDGTRQNKCNENDARTSRKRRSSSPSSQSNFLPKRTKNEKPIQYKPLEKLMEDVVLVISGIQNPDRGIIRQKAIELGARYKPDWTDGCTHLICAFKNTPKYNQVKGKGKIITRQWIEKCHKLKRRLPWRRFALEDREAEKPESEDEIYDLSLKPVDTLVPDTKSLTINQTDESRREDSTQAEDSSEDVLIHYDNADNQSYLVSSGSDTDEELEKIVKLENNKIDEQISNRTARVPNKESPPDRKSEKKFIIFEASTEEDENIKVPKQDPESPNYFEGMKFYLSNRLSAADLLKTKKYIKSCHGQFVNNLSEADYVISTDKVETNAEFKGEVVTPLWVFECNDMECRVPTRRYLV